MTAPIDLVHASECACQECVPFTVSAMHPAAAVAPVTRYARACSECGNVAAARLETILGLRTCTAGCPGRSP